MEKYIWVCEDCLGENLEKNKEGKIKEWKTVEICGACDDEIESYCLDCESFTMKLDVGLINIK